MDSATDQQTTSPVIQPLYQGFTPIASCHFQNMANILEAYGLPDARRKICVAWGFGWNGQDGILYASNRWTILANQLYGLDLQRLDFPDWASAAAAEQELIAAGLPFVAEVDAYALPSPYQGKEHVIHTVIVLGQAGQEIVVLDSNNLPEPTCYDQQTYQAMRVAPCEGRIEPYVVYATRRIAPQPTDLATIVEVFRADHKQHWARDLATLDAFISWASAASEPINVCRVPAERTYLAAFFELLGEHDTRLAHFAGRMAEITERWYLLHMLTVNEQTVRRPQRPRMIRLLQELRAWEATLATDLDQALLDCFGPSQ